MSIVIEKLKGGMIRTYSDAGFMIYGGSPVGYYQDAIDPEEANRTYTETDKPIEEVEDVPSDGSDTAPLANDEYAAELAALKAKYGITE